MYESFNSAFARSRVLKNQIFTRVKIVQAGDIAEHVRIVSANVLEWWRNAPHEVQDALSGNRELNFPTSFPATYEANLREVAEKRRERVILPWGAALPVRLADYESILGLMAAVTNPLVTPRDVFRTDKQVIVHFPFQGYLTLTRSQDGVALNYNPYEHRHLHLRNFNHLDRKPGLSDIHQVLLEQYGELKHGIRAIDVADNGWRIAQKLGVMVTMTHQEGGDPEYASYTDYGPYYPHNFLVTDEHEGGAYDFDYQFEFVAVPEFKFKP